MRTCVTTLLLALANSATAVELPGWLDHFSIEPIHGGAFVSVEMGGTWLDGCVPDAISHEIESSRITLTVDYPALNVGCTDALTPWLLSTTVGPIEDGRYGVSGQVDAVDPTDRTIRRRFEGPSTLAERHRVLVGDFNVDGKLNLPDINQLSRAAIDDDYRPLFDLDVDGDVDGDDRVVWVKHIAQTYFGDANLNGVFNTGDLVSVFQVGQYEDGVPNNSLWQDGDWNGDFDFGSGDLVTAFQDGGYATNRARSALVPEPCTVTLLLLGIGVLRRNRLSKLR